MTVRKHCRSHSSMVDLAVVRAHSSPAMTSSHSSMVDPNAMLRQLREGNKEVHIPLWSILTIAASSGAIVANEFTFLYGRS